MEYTQHERTEQETAAVLYELALHGVSLELSRPVSLLEFDRQALQMHLDKYGPEYSMEKANAILTDMGVALNSLNRQADNLAVLCACARKMMPVKKEPVDLAALLRSVMAAQEEIYRLIGVQLRLEYDPSEDWCILADRALAERILLNLLSNGLRACSAGQQVVFALQRKAGKVCLSVTDNGCGISPERARNAFLPLELSADRGENFRSGAGVGLFLCGEFSRLMDWKISLQPLARGTCVSLLIPLEKSFGRLTLRSSTQDDDSISWTSMLRELRTVPGLAGLGRA